MLPPTSRPAVAGEKPTVCPACGSTDLKTASKHIDASTYWNCSRCGEVWNAGRRQEDRRVGGGRRW